MSCAQVHAVVRSGNVQEALSNLFCNIPTVRHPQLNSDQKHGTSTPLGERQQPVTSTPLPPASPATQMAYRPSPVTVFSRYISHRSKQLCKAETLKKNSRNCSRKCQSCEIKSTKPKHPPHKPKHPPHKPKHSPHKPKHSLDHCWHRYAQPIATSTRFLQHCNKDICCIERMQSLDVIHVA